MKKGLIILFIIIIGAVGYLYFYPKSSSGNIKSLLPETSLFVLRIEDFSEARELLHSQPWFEAIQNLPMVSQVLSQAEAVESLERTGVIKSKLLDSELWISIHTTSSDELTPLFIIKSSGFDWKWESIESVINEASQQSFASSLQNFNDRDIRILKSEEMSLAGLLDGPYLIFSENTLLIEDVVRSIQEEESRLVSDVETLTFNSGIGLIINSNRLKELRSTFYQNSTTELTNSKVEGNILLDLEIRGDEVVFRGVGENQNIDSSGPSTVFGKNLIPIVSTSFSWSPNTVQVEGIKDYLEDGVCKVFLNQGGLDSKEVYIFQVNDTASVNEALLSVANDKLTPSDSAVYNERFISSNIGYINDEGYLGGLISGNSSPKGAPFYALFQQVLLMSDDLDALKTILNDFDGEATWGRSIEKRRILDDMIQETDLTFVQDFEFASDPIVKRLKPKWREFFKLNPEMMDVLELFKFQLNRTSSSMLVSGNLVFKEYFKTTRQMKSDIDPENDILANIFADGAITSKPFVVKNHNNSDLEVVFQDEMRNLYLANKQGEVLWKRLLSGELRGDVHQVDFYKNKKLQYLMFSDSLIYLIDRNGNDVDGFPKAIIPNRPFNGSSIIDYDNSKQYRYLAMDRRGDLSLYNKQGELLDGWDPKSLGSALLETPFHVRIRGRDCFVAIETSGKIHLLNRKGEAYEGFPVEVDGRFAGDISLTRGANFDQTLISLMSEEGEFVQVNFNGELVSKKQFVRPNTRTTFSLAFDALKTKFNIIQNDGRTLTFYNDQLEETFSVNYPNSRQVSVDMYNFRNGKEVFVIRDNQEKVMRLVDKEGRFLTPVIPSNERVSILYYQNKLEYEVFVNFANQMNIYAVKPL